MDVKSLIEWMGQPWAGGCPFEDDIPHLSDPPTRLQVYAAMVSIGGRPGAGYGIITGGGLYGRVGLHQDEAFEYWQLSAFINGWLTGTEGAESTALVSLLNEEWVRIKTLELAKSGVEPSDEARDG